ncbi:hypothetical protein [Streptomyces silvisoli]|uniref:Regulator component n=1 Tax=Streptomyces silvisoli TaxID=3034235 RepID=A0ABT5ZP86_9ACTN|nr:hypothetical protein [Streptomyces silvisoli]MDF3291649.1 hypothetical protein [Streptomyces silvisoli]
MPYTGKSTDRTPLERHRERERERELCRRCRTVLDGIRLPRPFSVAALCRQLSERRGRPLHLHMLPAEVATAGACGLWLATETDDHIFFERRTTRPHQDHIILHEIAHLLFDHHSAGARDGGALGGLLPDLDLRLVRRLLARTSYTTDQEREAEMLASLIRTEADRPAAPAASGVLGGLEAALGVDGTGEIPAAG